MRFYDDFKKDDKSYRNCQENLTNIHYVVPASIVYVFLRFPLNIP